MTPSAGRPEARLADIWLKVGAGTDRGLARELNEDAYLAVDPLFTVADGMGGHEAGEVASHECISVLGRQWFLARGSRQATASNLQAALRKADARIREMTGSRAGTTISGVVLTNEDGLPNWLVFNVGDSRTYCLRQGALKQLTVDHSEVQELVDGGFISPEQARVHPRRHVITRALGAGSDAGADCRLIPVNDGDRILVCSDGLTGELNDSQIQGILVAGHDPQDTVDSLIQSALRAGGRDNITAIVLDATIVSGPAGTHTPDEPGTTRHAKSGTLPMASQPAATGTATTRPSAIDDTAGQEHAGTPVHEENHGRH